MNNDKEQGNSAYCLFKDNAAVTSGTVKDIVDYIYESLGSEVQRETIRRVVYGLISGERKSYRDYTICEGSLTEEFKKMLRQTFTTYQNKIAPKKTDAFRAYEPHTRLVLDKMFEYANFAKNKVEEEIAKEFYLNFTALYNRDETINKEALSKLISLCEKFNLTYTLNFGEMSGTYFLFDKRHLVHTLNNPYILKSSHNIYNQEIRQDELEKYAETCRQNREELSELMSITE